MVRHEVVESVVTALKGLLVGQPGLLQQVDHHVSTRQLTSLVEVDTDEFYKAGGVVIPDSLCITCVKFSLIASVLPKNMILIKRYFFSKYYLTFLHKV